MNIKSIIAVAILTCFIASSAAAQTWLPPKEIAPKTETNASPTPATPAPATTAKDADKPKKEAKAKDCKAQSAAKGLHGPERKKFLEECKHS